LKRKRGLKKRRAIDVPAERCGHFPVSLHKGFALVMALVIVVVGSVLSGILIHMGYSFLTSTRQQRNFYGDHLSVTDYIQEVKGLLIQANIDRGAGGGGVWHGQGLDDELDSEIRSVSDLLLNDARFSFDADVVSIGQERQKVRVNVFDVHYHERQLQDGLREDAAQMRILPAPINATGGRAASSINDTEGDGKSPGKGTIEGSVGGTYPWDRFGAYVVRVQLFNAGTAGRLTPVRTAEEAFYQILSPDTAP
jgi:hypothetical protein